MSKALHARKIVETNANLSAKELIDLFVSELGMNRIMARTYLYNARKAISTPVTKQPSKMAQAAVMAAAKKTKKVNTTDEASN